MLCELAVSYDLSLLSLWALLCVLGLFAVFVSSGVVFYIQYVHHNYEQWCYKTLPTYPSASDVRQEILATLKGMAAATVPPTLSIYLSQRGYSSGLRHIMHTGRLIQDKSLRSSCDTSLTMMSNNSGYCGVEPFGWGYLFATFVFAFVG